ncbi:MAG: NADPH-dependent FMN reductase [Candidatus Pacearchaeota archaeon]
MTLKVVLVYGSVRENRQGIKAARFMKKKLEERGYEVNFIDPKEWGLPLLEKMYKSYDEDQAPEKLQKLQKIIDEADGYILVSAEYNHGPPAALKNLLDHFLEEYYTKASALVTYSAGSFGGVRAAVEWRAILSEMGMPSIPTVLPIPKVQDAFDDDGSPQDEKYHERAEKFLSEFEWYAMALKQKREAEGKPNE